MVLPLAAGDHTFTFHVREDGTALDKLTLVRVTGSDDPVPAFTASCTDLTCSFDASGSSDDGSVVSYDWDFGDGNTATGANTSHTFAVGGTFDVTLVVTDNDGNAVPLTDQVDVIDPGGPTASFTHSCVGTLCDFDGTSSTDPDGTVVSYDWDFGDGNTATGATASHTYALSGIYNVSLTVADDIGNTTTTTTSITVQPPGCGSLDAEAELGDLTGNFIETTDGARTVVVAPNGTGAADTFAEAQPLGYVELCFSVEVAGSYELDATVRGPDNGSNSFWVTVDNHVNGSVVNWRYDSTGTEYVDEFVRRYTLTPGEHTVRFWVREPGSLLDSAHFVPEF